MVLWVARASGQEQQGSGSVYSAYGLGDLMGNLQVQQSLMGGVGVALADPYGVSPLNPAAHAFLLRPVFETGAKGRRVTSEIGEESNTGGGLELTGISFGAPFGQGRWGMALGLSPVSRVGYDIEDRMQVPGQETEVELRYLGSGGLNRAFLGVGHMLMRRADSLGNGGRLAFGAEVDYVFGAVEETRKAIYPRGSGFYNANIFSSLVLRGPTGRLGVQYHGDLVRKRDRDDDGLRWIVGLSAELPTRMPARRTEVVNNYLLGNTGVEFPIDTIAFTDGQKGRLLLPLQWNLAVSVQDARWMATAEYRRRDWQRLEADVADLALRTELGTQVYHGLGFSYKPSGDGRGNFWSTTIYRAGLRYVEDYLVVRGEPIREFGMAFGLSMPVMSSTTRSRVSIGAELGERGTLEQGLIRERFAHLFVGLSITPDLREQWFKKRRIE